MCVVTLPSIPEFKLKERKVVTYVDLDTGNIYGSEKVTKRYQHKDGFVTSNTCTTVENQVATKFYGKFKTTNGPWLKGSIVRETPDNVVESRHQGKGSKLKFVLFSKS